MDAVLNGPNGVTQLGPGGVMLGRTPDNQIVVNDGKASSQHAEIRPSGQGYTVTDLGSMNGTYVNGQKLERNMPRMLMPGDTIQIGDTTYTYQAQDYAQPGMYASPISPPASNYAPTQAASPPQQAFQATSYGGPAGYQPTLPAQPGSGYQPTMPAYPQYDQQYNPAPAQGYTPPPPPGQSVPSPYDYDQNNAPTQQASYFAGGAGLSSSPYNVNQSYTPGVSAGTPPYNPTPGYPVQGGGYVPPGPGRRKRSPLLTIILVAVALVVIIGAVSTFFVVHNNQVAANNANATSTATAKGNATGTALTQATGVAVANATASATTQNANPYASSGTLVLADTLKDNSGGHGWAENSNCTFAQGVYTITESHQNTFFYCYAKSTNYTNFAFDAELKIVSGDCGGLVFNANTSSSAEYYFQLCQDGSYGLVLFDGNNGKYLIQPAQSSAIKSGLNQINTPGVVVNNGKIQLFINGTSVDQIQDSTYSSGSIGLLALNQTSSSTFVGFANVRVWQL